MITDYATLQTEVAMYLHRTDLETMIPTFIQLAESKIANSIKGRRSSTELDLSTVAAQDYVTLPTDYESLNSIRVSDTNALLKLVPDDSFYKYKEAGEAVGVPNIYTIENDKIKLYPTPDAEYTIRIVYNQSLPTVTASNPNNWVLTKYPYIYLYGALIEASVYIIDPEQVQFFQGKFDSAIADLWFNSANESFSGSPLRAVSDYIV